MLSLVLQVNVLRAVLRVAVLSLCVFFVRIIGGGDGPTWFNGPPALRHYLRAPLRAPPPGAMVQGLLCHSGLQVQLTLTPLLVTLYTVTVIHPLSPSPSRTGVICYLLTLSTGTVPRCQSQLQVHFPFPRHSVRPLRLSC